MSVVPLANSTNPGSSVNGGSKKKTNPFHAIRQREFGREQQFQSGTEPTSIPAAYFTPSLKEVCAKVIAQTFDQQPSIDHLRVLDEQLYHLITDQLRTDLPLEVSVPRVRVQEYWKACCEARWSIGQLTEYTGSMNLEPPSKGGWKRVFLERHLEEHLMAMESTTTTEKEEDALVSLCTLCGSEIYSLKLTRQRSHFDIYELFSRLPHLEEFLVTFGVVNATVAFQPEMVGLKQQDAMHLQKVLRTSKFLTTLSLPENDIEDDLCRCIVAGLVKNTTLTSLDLSHNRIGDAGANAIGVVLLQKELLLEHLDLSDNEIREAGSTAIGDGLAVSTTLRRLSLRLNRLEDVGGETLLNGVRFNASVTSLDLSNNQLGIETARAFVDLGGQNSTLLSLNLSCNGFGADGGAILKEGAARNPSLRTLDVRHSAVGAEDEEAMARIMADRVAKKYQEQVASSDAAMRADIDRLVSERVRKTHGV